EQRAQLTDGILIGERRVRRSPGADLLRELRRVGVSCDRDQSKTLRMAAEHIECALANRPRGTEHRYADHGTTPSSDSPSSSTGAAPVRLSMRSMTPPRPGKMLPPSFMPAQRFTRRSVSAPAAQ